MNPWDIIWPENSETDTLDEASVEDKTQYDSYIPQDEPVASLAEPTQDAWDQTQWVDPSLSSSGYTDLPSPEPSTYQSNVELDNPIPAPDVVYPEDNYTVSTPESEPVPELLNLDSGVETNALVQYEEPQPKQALMSVDVPQEQINIPDVISGLDETNYALSPTGLGKAVGDAAFATYKEDAPIAEKGIDTAIGAIGNVASNVSKIAAKFSSDATSELETQDTYGVINYLNRIGYDETTAIGQTARDLANPNKSVVGKIGSVALTAIDTLFGEPARQVEKIIGVGRSYVPRVAEDESIPQFGKYSNSFGLIGELLSLPAKLPEFVAGDIMARIEGKAPPPKEQRVLSDEIAAMIAYADSQGYQSSYYEKDKATGNFGSLGAKLGIELGKSFSALLTGNESAKLYQENYEKTKWTIDQTSSSAYSSYEAQVAIAKRIAFGENPIIAKQGIQEPDKNALLVDKESWAAHVYNRIEVAGRIAEYEGKKKNLTSESIEANINAAKKEEAEKIARNKSIEGDENIAAEMLGQMILDPLNLVGGLGLFDDAIKRGTGQKLAQDLLKAEREFSPLAKDAEIIASKEVLIEQALKGMPETFVRSFQNLKEENAALRQAAKPSVVKELLEDSFDAVEAVIGYPPGVQASIKADHATSLLIQLASLQNADNASEVVSYISQIVSKNKELWQDTKTISDVLGEALPKSAKMEIAREVMDVAYDDLVKTALKSQTADGFSRQKFLNESFDILQQAAKTTVPGAIQAETKFQQARELAAATVRATKAMLSKVFLNNPGSVLRNTGGDLFGIAIDDLIRESGGMKTADYLSHYGGSERVISASKDAIRAKYSFAEELRGGGKGIIHNLTSAIMEKGSEWEQARYQHAFIAAHEQFMRAELKYAISDGIRAGVPEDMIQSILARASESSLSPKSIAGEIRAMGKGKYTPPAIHELSGVTAEEIRKTIDPGDIEEIRKTYNAAVNAGKSKKDIIDDLDKLVESRKKRTSVVAANNGISNTPVTNRAANAATDVNHDISQVVSVARTSGADPSEASKLVTTIKTQRDAFEKGFTDVMAQAKNKDIAPKVFSAMLDEEAHHYDEYYKAQLLAHETAINKASIAGDNKAAKAAAWREYYSASESAAEKLSLNIQSVHQTYSDAIRVGDLSSIPTPKNSFIDAYTSLLEEIESLNKQGLPSDSLRISLLSGRATFLNEKSNLVDVASKAVSEINNDEFTFRAFSHIKNAEVDSAKIFEKAAGQRTIVNSQVNNFYITIDEGEKLKAKIWQTAMRESRDRILAAKEAIEAELRLAGDWQTQLKLLGYSEERIKAYEQGAKYGTTVIEINTILRDKIHAAQSPVAGTTKKISTTEQRKEINRLAISRGNVVIERNGTTVIDAKRVLNSLNANREPFTKEFKSLEEAYGLRYGEAVKALSSERSAFAQADYLNRQLPTLSKEINNLRELLKAGETTEDIIAGKVKHYEEVLAEVKRLDNLAANLPPMTTDEFERQLAMSFRLTKEETNASIAIIKARAESRGISYSDYVAERFASVRKTDKQGLVSSLKRTGVPSLEIKYPDGKISVISEASIAEKELNLLKSTPGVEIISHPNGVFEYDGLIEPRLLYQYAGDKATLNSGAGKARTVARGAVTFNPEDGRAIIYALKQPTVETFVHEIGHVFRRELTDAQLEVAGKWVGVGKNKVWNTANEEKFANGFVEYLRLGNAPTPELKNVFEKFKEWITNIWKNLSGEALPENMKALYSELLAPATKTAEGIIPGPIAKVNSSIDPKLADIRMKNAEELLRRNPDNPLAISEYSAAEKNLKLSNATVRVNNLNDEILSLELKIRENPTQQHPDLFATQQKLQKEIDSILAEHPEGIPILQNASNSSADTFIKQNISASVNGVGDPPMKHEIDSVKSKAFEDLVAKIKNNIETRIDIPSPEIANWDKTSKRIINHLQAQWNELNAKAIADATARADFSLLDYSKQRGFDAFIQVIAPYSFWPTRQARNYAVRLLKDPEILMHWLRFKDFEEKLNEQRGTNKSLQGKYNLNELSGGLIKGGYADSLYFAPLSGIVPLGDIFRTNAYEPSRERSSMQMIYDTASMLGVSPNPFIDTVVRGTGALVRTTDSQGNPLSKEDIEKESANYGGESLGYYWPFGSALSGITAAAGMNNGAGLNIERSMLKALGVQPRLQELKLISAGISSYSFENQKNQNYDPRYGVLAQAIHERNKDSYAKIDDLMYGNTFEISKRLAGEMQVSRKDAEIALTIYREGVARAAKERGVSRLFTWSTGMSSRYLSEGTKMQEEEQKDESGAAYNKATKTGSRAALESIRDKNPANVVARAQFATYPGDKKDPIDQWEWMEKQRIITSFGVIKDEFIKKNPADRKGAKAIDIAMWKEWAKVGADLIEEPTAVTSWEKKLNEIKGQLNNKTKLSESTSATIVYAPKSIYGASPDEVFEIRKGEILKSYKDKRPSPDNFIDSEGDVNYAAYKSAMESWSTNVKDKIMADKTTSAVLDQALKDGNGTYENLNKWLAGNLDEDLKKYKARYDSPIEAAQELWFTKIYSKAFDDYGLLKSSDKKAYEKTIGSIPEMSDADLIKLVKANNFGMWKDSVIEEQIKGMKMPSGKDVSRLSMSKDKAEIEAAFKLFTETLSAKIPVGRVYDNLMKSNPLIAGVNAALYNSDLRKKVTPEMIAQAQIMVAGYASANRITPNPVEWAEAKKLVDDRNKDMAAKYGDKWKDTIDKYFELTAKERADRVKKDPVLAGMLKDYSSLKDNPLYKKYYAVDSTQNASGSSLGSPSGGVPSQGKSQVDRKTQALFWDSYGKLSSSDKSSLMKSNPMLARIINSETRLSVQPEMWSYYTQLMNGDINKEQLSKLVKESQTDKQARSVFWDEYLRTNNQVKRVAFGLPQVMKIIDDKTRDSATKEEFQAAYEILKEANNNYAGRKSTAPNVASPPQAKSQQPSTPVKTNPVKVSQTPRAVPVTRRPIVEPAVRRPIVEPAVISKDNSLPQAFQKMYKSIPPSTLSQMVKDRPVIEKAKESGDINDLAMAIAAMEKWVPSQNKIKTLPPQAAPSIRQPFGTPARSSGGGKKPFLGRRPPRGKRGANTNTKVISPYKGK